MKTMFGSKVFLLAGMIALTLSPHVIQAQSCYWTNQSSVATTAWSTPGNWTNSSPTAPGGSSYVLYFNAGTGAHSSSNDLSGSFSLNRLDFKPGTYTLYGNELVFTGGNAILTNYSGATVVISNNITLDANTAFGGNSMNCGGVINLGNKTLTLTVYPGFSSSSKLTGSGGSVIIPIGLIIASANHDYTGGTTLSGSGNITLNASSVGSPGSLTKGPFGTGTLILNGASMGPPSSIDPIIGNDVVISKDTAFTSTSSKHSLIFNGPVTLSASRTVTVSLGTNDVSKSLTISGVIGDGGNHYNLIKAGPGRMLLSGANTYGGETVISEGALIVSNTLALANSTLNYTNGTVEFGSNITTYTLGGLAGTVNSVNMGLTNVGGTAIALAVGNNTSNTAYSGVLSGAGSLIKVGTGSLKLDGVSTYTGATTVSNGTLEVNAVYAGGGTVTVVSNATLAGTGTLSNVLCLAGSVLQPATSNSMGTLTLGNGAGTLGLTNVVLALNVDAAGGADVVAVNGGVVLTNCTLSVTGTNLLNYHYDYPIMTWTGSKTIGSFVASNLPIGWHAVTEANRLILQCTAPGFVLRIQ